MTIPDTGTDWIGAGLDLRGPEFLRRGTGVAVLARDARGAATNVSPHNEDGSMRWSPFAADGDPRDDLLAIIKPDGYFQPNPEPNEGFINLGPQKDGDGPSWKPKITNDHFMILQSTEPYASDITEQSEPFSVTPVDTGSPWVQRLRLNRPFTDKDGNSLIEDSGLQNAVYARLVTNANPGRQFLFFRSTEWGGLPVYSCDVIALARLDDIGNSKMDKKDSEASELTYLPVADGRCMAVQDGIYQPVKIYRIWGGAGYTALGGLPVFGGSAPVATATTALHATLAFTEPTGPSDPWTYKVQQSTDGGSTWGSAITPSSVSVSTGTVTLAFAAVAGASKFRAVATGTNGASANTANSNSATIAAS